MGNIRFARGIYRIVLGWILAGNSEAHVSVNNYTCARNYVTNVSTFIFVLLSGRKVRVYVHYRIRHK